MRRPLELLAVSLFHKKALQFGSFRLPLHDKQPLAPLAPIYFNLRTPDNVKPGPLGIDEIRHIAGALISVIATDGIVYEGVTGIPNAGVPFVDGMQEIANGTLQVVHLEKKTEGGVRAIDHVTKKGGLHRGARVLMIDDVVTSAQSKIESIRVLRKAGFIVEDLLVVIDRQQGGRRLVEQEGVFVHRVFTLTDLVSFYQSKGWVSMEKSQEVLKYLGVTS
jgi:uridine monophosphate synthetase